MLDAAPVVVRSGCTTVVAAEPVEVVAAWGDDALDALDRLTPGWWAGLLSYDLGRSIERVVPRHGEEQLRGDRVLEEDRGVPDVLLARYDARLVVAGSQVGFEGRRAATHRLERLLTRAPTPTPPVPLGAAISSLDRDEYEAGVAAIIELIEAGECYQVNLTRRLSWDRAADGRALHHALATRNPAPHAGLFALPRPHAGPLVVVSASPERFLSWRGRDVETRPIKGTARRAEPLMASTKDRAENVMIVDLARNDLGRVCEFGSVHVPALCAVEHHPGLHHLVSTVRGRLRADVGVRELVRATFPPASVTGAPKPRVLQAIEDLEPVRRGVYCGAIGWLDTERGEGDFAVAIRTFTIADGRTHLGVGAGIVADSDPGAEWRETELKAERLIAAADASAAAERSDRSERSERSETRVTRVPL